MNKGKGGRLERKKKPEQEKCQEKRLLQQELQEEHFGQIVKTTLYL